MNENNLISIFIFHNCFKLWKCWSVLFIGHKLLLCVTCYIGERLEICLFVFWSNQTCFLLPVSQISLLACSLILTEVIITLKKICKRLLTISCSDLTIWLWSKNVLKHIGEIGYMNPSVDSLHFNHENLKHDTYMHWIKSRLIVCGLIGQTHTNRHIVDKDCENIISLE